MAEQQNYSKIVVGDKIVLDLSKDTIKPSNLLKDETAHDKQGNPIVGECTFDADTRDATALNGEVLEGATYYKGGSKETGTMPRKGSQESYLRDKNDKVAIGYGFHDGGGFVSLTEDDKALIVPENIREGVSFLGVEGGMKGNEGVQAQHRTVTPTFSKQEITPQTEQGYNYLSQVTIEAIPVAEKTETIGGEDFVTLIIG